MSTTLITAWIIGFVVKAEPLSTGAMRLTLDNGQIGIVESPQSINLSYLLEPTRQDGFQNDGVAFKKNQQNFITEICRARVRVAINTMWKKDSSSSLVLSFYRHHGGEEKKPLVYQEGYLSIGVDPAPTPYELHPTLSDFSSFRRIAEDAAKNSKPVDLVLGSHPLEIIHIQYSQSAFKNPPGSLHRFSGEG